MLPRVSPREDRHELPDPRTPEPVEGMLRCFVDPVTGLIPVLVRELLPQALERIPGRSFLRGRAHRGSPRLLRRPICTGNRGDSASLPRRVRIARRGRGRGGGRGDFFGEMAMMGDGRRVADVVATSPITLFEMFGTHFRELEMTLPDVAARIRATLEERRAAL
jgi:CRP-like cAMP-binding protein